MSCMVYALTEVTEIPAALLGGALVISTLVHKFIGTVIHHRTLAVLHL